MRSIYAESAKELFEICMYVYVTYMRRLLRVMHSTYSICLYVHINMYVCIDIYVYNLCTIYGQIK